MSNSESNSESEKQSKLYFSLSHSISTSNNSCDLVLVSFWVCGFGKGLFFWFSSFFSCALQKGQSGPHPPFSFLGPSDIIGVSGLASSFEEEMNHCSCLVWLDSHSEEAIVYHQFYCQLFYQLLATGCLFLLLQVGFHSRVLVEPVIQGGLLR